VFLIPFANCVDHLVIATRGANLIQVNTVPLWIESERISILSPFLLHFLTVATCCWLQIETNDLPQSEWSGSRWALHTSALHSAPVTFTATLCDGIFAGEQPCHYGVCIRRFGDYLSITASSAAVTVTGRELADREIGVRVSVVGKDFHFSMPSRLTLGPTQSPIQWVPGANSPGG
jgi:hypothetical protein